MSRYHPVRPKKKKPSKLPLRPIEGENINEKYRNAIEEAAEALYIERHGATLDASLLRVKRTLALFDREIEKLTDDEDPNHRWRISPSTALQWQREQQRVIERIETLRNECWTIARQMIDEWMNANNTDHPQQATHGTAPSGPDIHSDINEQSRAAHEEGGQADAGRQTDQ